MAGANIQIDYEDEEVLDVLGRLVEVTENTEPVMMEIAEYLHERTRDHFDDETAPDGTPWAPLAESTKKRKADQGVPIDKILHGQSLHLRDTIFPFWSRNEAGVSTGPGTEAYAAAHQFGTEDMTIQVPAHQRLMTQVFGNELPFPMWVNVGAYSFKGALVPRPFLGIGEEDQREVLDILEEEIFNSL